MLIEEWKKSGIATKYPSYRNSKLITPDSWIVGKRQDDEAEGLWRIYDGIYDLTEFIDKHPGGSFWINQSKGTDITELFEMHHLTTAPTKLLAKYKVRDAAKPRIYTLTLNDNGFYKTLKRRVMEKLKTLDYTPKKKSDLIHSALLTALFVFAIASAKYDSLLCLALAATALCWTGIAAHNYLHRRDNWRMYTMNLTMMNFCSWRISHVMSHHGYPNSFLDLELSMLEPFICWIPNPYIKSLKMRYVSWITGPLLYMTTFFLQMLTRIIYSVLHSNAMYWNDLICLTIPFSIYLSTDLPLLLCVRQWLYITIVASIAFSIITFNAAHHDPKIYHDGDANRLDRDWGLFQVDTIIDRGDIKGSQFMVLTHFGEHALHHLFPTLDHGILPQLNPILYTTLAEFEAELRECNHLQHIVGQHKQLLRTEPNLKPVGSK